MRRRVGLSSSSAVVDTMATLSRLRYPIRPAVCRQRRPARRAMAETMSKILNSHGGGRFGFRLLVCRFPGVLQKQRRPLRDPVCAWGEVSRQADTARQLRGC